VSSSRESELARRLRRSGPRHLIAAELVSSLLARRGWTMHENATASRIFSPPGHNQGERGLRIHFESTGHRPALEFALKELRQRGAVDAANALRARIAGLAEPHTASDRFPSVPLDRLLAKWECEGRNVVLTYARARERVVNAGRNPG
jgi:hypothetical protein